MIIDHTHKLIFVHVPKTGGTSITAALCKAYGWMSPPGGEDVSTLDEVRGWNNKLHRYAQHARYKHLNGYYSFGFVRNPYDRAFSWYSAAKMATENPRNSVLISNARKAGDFNEWMTMLPPFRGKQFLRPQALLLSCRRTGRKPTFIGRYEQLDEGWRVVCDSLGIPFVPLPRRNWSSHGEYRGYYNDEGRKVVEERYAADLDVFGYEF